MIIGLTGGIATGKSHVSRYLVHRGYQVIDADLVTRQVQAQGSPGLAAMVKVFGSQILNPDATLNRQKLGQIVFSHPRLLKRLVRIIDPFIRRRIIGELRYYRTRGARKIVLDAPTLFENGYQYLVDRIVTVVCDPVRQLRRLMRRNHLSISAAEARVASQWPLSIKVTLSDVVINSDGPVWQTRRQVVQLIRDHKL